MVKNYFKIAWRTLVRDRTYAFVNIAGLAIGLAVFMVALIYVNHETAYDRWDEQLQKVYRVGISEIQEGEKSEAYWTAYPLGTRMAETCPEVAAVTRITEMAEQNVLLGENRFYENRVIQADSSFFQVFPYRFLFGDPLTALNRPDAAVIDAAMSRKYFGSANPVGKMMEIETAFSEKKTYTITGVIQKTGPSHLNFNICLASFTKNPNHWGKQFFITYVRLKAGMTAAAVETKTKDIYVNGRAAYLYMELNKEGTQTLPSPGNTPEQWLQTQARLAQVSVFLEPAARIHLQPRAIGWRDAAANHPVNDYARGNKQPVIIFSVAALLVLLLACINYTNLCIARAGRRARESGVRKVMGAGRKQLIFQFLAEAFLQVLAASVLGLVLAIGMKGFINSAFGMELSFWNKPAPAENIYFIVQLIAVVLLVTVLSGAYPAFVLSGYRPAKVLKGDNTGDNRGRFLRNGLVVVQFAITACFITALVIVYLQLRHMRTNDPGFNTEQVLVIKPADTDLISPQREKQKLSFIRAGITRLPGVKTVTAAAAYPGMPSINVQEAAFDEKTAAMCFEYVYFDYFRTMGMSIVEGRDFSTDFAMDSVNTTVINETAARLLGGKTAVGRRIRILERNYTVAGVLKDNLTAGYTQRVLPAIYAIGAEPGYLGGYSALLVKLDAANAANTTAAITAYWKTLEPEFPLRSAWADQEFAKLNSKYERFGKLTALLALVSLSIALMGIFALSAFATVLRAREIGIRKVLGASVLNVTFLLSGEFLKLVIIALLIASPLAWWVMNKWLENFAYRINISGLIFLFTGLLTVIVALLTVSIQTVKAAIANPVKSLRTE